MEQQGLWERAERLRGAADGTARLAQNVYRSFLLFGMYIAIIIGSTTDMQLLKVSPVTLPLFSVQLPIVGFYLVVPWLLLLIYFNLLLHLTFLAQSLHRLNAMLAGFPDDIVREEQRLRLFPFPFSVMLIGRPAHWRLRIPLGLMVLITMVLLPLMLLLWAQVRFLPYHDTAITWNHRVAVLIDLLLLWLFGPLMLPPVQRPASAAPSHRLWRVVQHRALAKRFRWWAGLLCLILVTVVGLVLSLAGAVLPEEAMERRMASCLPEAWVQDYSSPTGKPVFWLTYWLFERPGALFYRNLRLQERDLVAGEPSAEVIAALRSKDENKRRQGLEKITSLSLTNRDLRGAALRDVLLAGGDLRGANLKGAQLLRAEVFAANLSPFFLSKRERCVDKAQQGEDDDACATNLQEADLGGAQLQGANLMGAWLQGANLMGAELQGANLVSANLQCADLSAAQLQGANLAGARLQGAKLAGVRLQGANLEYARLQAAELQVAQLQGANLEYAQIGGAYFNKAVLTLSNLQSLEQSPLDEEAYEELARGLTLVISDKSRADCLKRLKSFVGRPPELKTVFSAAQVLCDDINLFPSCLTKKEITDYVHARASFLGELGCNDATIARGVVPGLDYPLGINLVRPEKDLMQTTAAKHFLAIQKDCPGWAALPAPYKIMLGDWAARQISPP
jgi:uncharacterized protein YjbI with pentapeptide repeats